MGACGICGRSAGFGQFKHDECVENEKAAQAAAKAGIVTQPGVELTESQILARDLAAALRPVLMDAAAKGGATGAWILVAFIFVVGCIWFIFGLFAAATTR